MKKVGVAILGLGVVGAGTYGILTDKQQYFANAQKLDVTVEAVLETRKERALSLGVPASILCENISEIVSDPAVDIVVECIGGEEPALSFLKSALKNGKTCVTSNKEVFSKHWHELQEIAQKNDSDIYFEASCMGGVPVVRVLCEAMQANHIQKIAGVINGTTNYVLTKMEEGFSFADALLGAQEKGYAEANPKADVEGYDSTYKLCILAGLAFHTKITVDQISRKGITEIDQKDVAAAKAMGYSMKLLAVAKRTAKGIEARVEPALVKKEHPVAAVSDCFNALSIVGDSVGEVVLTGRGAGAAPTGSAIVSDVIFAAKKGAHSYREFFAEGKTDKISAEVTAGHYFRFATSAPDAVLAKIVPALSKCGATVNNVWREDGELCVITAEATLSAVNKALAKLNLKDCTLVSHYCVEAVGE